jgi:hypothetical protein
MPFKQRNVGTYPLEGFFSTLVVTNRGNKPTAPQATHIMRRVARVAEIRFMEGRPFFETVSKSQHYDHSLSALSLVPQNTDAWNDGSTLGQTDRSNESGKKRKGVFADKHLVTEATIRQHHKKRKIS